ncbi:chemotaxis response regulator protein-glutamate methylesterase [Povalibacter sp.]|uniref:chemotaxis response regulator protein-glutamate methylesterase n=1 Tax=Povalibacter sp. TaxID=1962978 RepID=UPI002F42F3F5
MKIGIANDLPLAVEVQRRALALRPDHEVIWIARDGAQAVELCARQMPDLVLMDLIMPVMDGVEATRQIMTGTPCAILLVTASVGANTGRVFDAMGHGAIDAVDTPVLNLNDPQASVAAFLKKIDTIARLIGTRRFIPGPDMFGETWAITRRQRLIAIGASAGGPGALAILLAGLPKDFAAAIVIVQHVDERFAAGMADWLNRDSPLPVRVAQEGDRLTAGTVLLAGTNDHLMLKAKDRIGYTPEPRDYPYRPSIDVFFESVSTVWSGEAVGVLLTGMGRDGAKGLKTLRSKGHYTIAQDQATSAVYGMPKAAATLGAAVDILPIERIAPRLIDMLREKL